MSRMSLLTLARPPTSSQVTFGIFGAPMLSEYAERAFSSAELKSSEVSATPAFAMSLKVGAVIVPSVGVASSSTRSAAAARARRTRSTRSLATSAAVWTARERRETSGEMMSEAVRLRRIARRSGSAGACDGAADCYSDGETGRVARRTDLDSDLLLEEAKDACGDFLDVRCRRNDHNRVTACLPAVADRREAVSKDRRHGRFCERSTSSIISILDSHSPRIDCEAGATKLTLPGLHRLTLPRERLDVPQHQHDGRTRERLVNRERPQPPLSLGVALAQEVKAVEFEQADARPARDGPDERAFAASSGALEEDGEREDVGRGARSEGREEEVVQPRSRGRGAEKRVGRKRDGERRLCVHEIVRRASNEESGTCSRTNP